MRMYLMRYKIETYYLLSTYFTKMLEIENLCKWITAKKIGPEKKIVLSVQWLSYIARSALVLLYNSILKISLFDSASFVLFCFYSSPLWRLRIIIFWQKRILPPRQSNCWKPLNFMSHNFFPYWFVLASLRIWIHILPCKISASIKCWLIHTACVTVGHFESK